MVRPLRLRAGWVLPIAGAPVRAGGILIGADGRIAAVGPDAQVPTPDDALLLDLGDAVLLPGLVNVHTHLELTGFQDLSDGREFRNWILTIRDRKRQRSAAEFLAAARDGIRDCWAGGVTTVADTGDSGAVLRALAELGGSGIVYQEVFGPHPGQLEDSMTGLQARVAALAPLATGRLRLGVSPHAPYTVSGPLYEAASSWARLERLPMAVHVAESPAESEFVTGGTGPFAEGWASRGIPPLSDPSHQPGRGSSSPSSPSPPSPPSSPSSPSSPVQWLDRHGVLGSDTLCIHAVQLTEADLATLAARGASVAHCPLSNARHGHGKAPLRGLISAGIPVGLGTDSVASVGRLDLLAETRAARALGDLSAEGGLALATLGGARALGLEAEIGSLTPGKWGDVAAVAGTRRPSDSGPGPFERVLGSTPADTLLTVLGGRVVYRREPEA